MFTILTGFPEIQPRPSQDYDFWDRKSQNRIFFKFFITKSPDFISNRNDNCSQLSLEVYNVCVAQKLRISEFLINFLSPGTWPLRRPPETSILAEYVSFHIIWDTVCWSGYLTDQKALVKIEFQYTPWLQEKGKDIESIQLKVTYIVHHAISKVISGIKRYKLLSCP